MVSPITSQTMTSVIPTPPGDERISRIVARNLRVEKSEAGKVPTPRRYADLSQHRSSTPFEELGQTEAETSLRPISTNRTRIRPKYKRLTLCHPEIAAGLTKTLNTELDRWVLLKLRELTSLDTPIDFETFVAHLLRRPDERETALLFLSRWIIEQTTQTFSIYQKGLDSHQKSALACMIQKAERTDTCQVSDALERSQLMLDLSIFLTMPNYSQADIWKNSACKLALLPI